MHGHHRHGRGRHGWREFAEAMMAARMGRGRHGHDHDGDEGGPGGGWGRGGGGGWGRGGGRMLGHGDLKLVLLALIGEKPRHGYDLIRAIEEKLAGAYSPSPGAIYPWLTMLEEQDLIRSTPEGAKKLYTITPEGEQFLKDNDAEVQGIMTRIALVAAHYSSREAPEQVWQAWKTLKQAMNMPRAPWTEEEAKRIVAILDKAARDIVERKG